MQTLDIAQIKKDMEAGILISRATHLEILAYTLKLEQDLMTMRASFYVNMIRAHPSKSHEEISAEIDKVLK